MIQPLRFDTARVSPALFAAALLAAIFLVAGAAPAVAADAAGDTTFAEKRSSRDAWEYVVSFPTDVIDFVLDIPFEAVKGTVEFVYKHKVIEKVVDLLTADDGSWGVVPVFEPRGGGGVKYFHRDLWVPGSRLDIHAKASRYHRQSYGIEMTELALFGGVLSTGFTLGYDFKSDEEFFGLGPGTEPGDETNFAEERASGEFRLGHQWGQHSTLSLAGAVGFEHTNILAGRRDDTPNLLGEPEAELLAGIGDHVRLVSLGAGVAGDSRDFEPSPTRGWYGIVRADRYQQVDDDLFAFWKLRADLTRHIEIAYRRVVDLRVAGEFTESDRERTVPFYHLSALGRHETIRGISNGRYRDANAVMGSVQYRWPVRRGTDGLLFVDAGNVFDNPDDFRKKYIDVGWGGGFRVYGSTGVFMTIEAAKSRDEWRFYFALN